MYTLDEMKQIRKDFGLSYKDIKEGCEGVSLSSIQKAFGGCDWKPLNLSSRNRAGL